MKWMIGARGTTEVGDNDISGLEAGARRDCAQMETSPSLDPIYSVVFCGFRPKTPQKFGNPRSLEKGRMRATTLEAGRLG
jgi:hypothetical protein